jgi:hypothetical protein
VVGKVMAAGVEVVMVGVGVARVVGVEVVMVEVGVRVVVVVAEAVGMGELEMGEGAIAWLMARSH